MIDVVDVKTGEVIAMFETHEEFLEYIKLYPDLIIDDEEVE